MNLDVIKADLAITRTIVDYGSPHPHQYALAKLLTDADEMLAEVERLRAWLGDYAALNRKLAGFNDPDRPPVMVPCRVVAADIEAACAGAMLAKQ